MIRSDVPAPSDRKRYRRPVTALVPVAAVAMLAGIAAVADARLTIAVAAVMVITSIVFLDGQNWRFFSEYGWIPYAWIVLCLTPDLKFASRNPLDTSISSTAPETYVQLLAYLLVAGLIILSRRGATAEDRGRLRLGTLLIWPLIALLSTAWSVVPLFTFVRASQLLVPIGLAFLMTRIWLSSPERGAAIWRDTLRIFVRVVTVLALIGFAAGFWKQRFTWPGAHPIVASLYMGLALLLLIACGRSFLHFRASGYVFRISLLAVGLYLGETRTVIAALLLALAVMFWWFGRTRPAVRFLGFFYYGLALVLLLVFALPGIVEYLARGETGQNLETLNGRIPLWEIAIDLVREAGRWFTGFGYGAARILLPTHVEWAGSAHSSWLELLLAIGIWGPLFGVIDIFSVLRHIPSRRAVADQALMMAMLAFLVVASIASETLVIPGLGFVILALLHVPILVERNSWGGADLRDGAAADLLPEAYGAGRAVPHP